MNIEKIDSILSRPDEQWEKPIELKNKNLPIFETDVFPKWLRNYIDAVAEETQTPKDVASMATIAVLSTIISRKFEVKLTNSWIETLNTYTVMALDPANRKSAVFNLFLKPINKYIEEQNEKLTPIIAEKVAARNALRKRLNILQEQYSKLKEGEGDYLLDEIKKLAKETDDQLNPINKIPRLYTNDVTPEQLAQLMYENNETIAILTSEGAELFEMIAGRYTNKSNLDIYLKGYSGDNVTIDRVTSGRKIFLKNPKLTIGLFVQPIVIQQLPSNFSSRGLTPRFLFFLPKSFVGYRKIQTEKIPLEVEQRFNTNILKLLELENSGTKLTFDKEAMEYLNCISEEIEEMLRNQDMNPDFKGWLGKLCGQLIRLAGLIHVSEHISSTRNEIPTTINIKTLSKANSLRNYFIIHAEQAFGNLNEDKQLDDINYVLNKVLVATNKKIERLPYQDLWQVVKRRIKKAEKLKEILHYLEELNYIRIEKFGRKQIIIINPYLIK